MNVERAQDLIGTTVYDREGNRVGKVGNVYIDDDTQQPGWVTVRIGLLGLKEHFAPLDGARTDENHLELNVDKNLVLGAPQVDAENGHLTELEGRDLYRYYGLADDLT